MVEANLEIQKYLNSARRSYFCAMQILMNVGDAESEIALHVARAWFSLSCALALEKGQPISDSKSASLEIDSSSLNFSRAMRKERWESELAIFQQSVYQTPEKQSDLQQISLASLKAHCDFLDREISTVSKRNRKKFRIPLPSSRILKKTLVVVAGMVLIFVFGRLLYGVIKGPEPWRAQFFANKNFAGKPQKITEHDQIDFFWSRKAPFFGFPKDNFSVRWDTCLELDSTKTVNFRLESDDGSRLKVDGKIMIDNWGIHSYVTKEKRLELPKGMHHLEVDFFEETLGAKVRLSADPNLLTKVNLTLPSGNQANPCKEIRR